MLQKNLKKGAKFDVPHTEFRTGKVGFGVDDPKHHLHVGGNHWAQGKMIVKNGFGRASMLTEVMSMLQVGETSDAAASQPKSTDHHDVGHMIVMMAKLVRKNKLRLEKQAASIALMEREMLATAAALRK